jgi:hypothetical protein
VKTIRGNYKYWQRYDDIWWCSSWCGCICMLLCFEGLRAAMVVYVYIYTCCRRTTEGVLRFSVSFLFITVIIYTCLRRWALCGSLCDLLPAQYDVGKRIQFVSTITTEDRLAANSTVISQPTEARGNMKWPVSIWITRFLGVVRLARNCILQIAKQIDI